MEVSRGTNKSALEAMGEEKFKEQFEVSDAVLQDVIDLAEADGIAFEPEQYKTSKLYLKTYIKSRIAHGIWGQDTAMAIMNEENEILQAALKHFEKAAMLAKNE
jgi:carboxyl-terminal processing protease